MGLQCLLDGGEDIWKEVASGNKDQRRERKKVLALAQDRRLDAILVTELTQWGRSTMDLVQSLHDLQAWNVSLIAQTGLQFDLSTPQGKLVASLMAALAEFERDLIRERIRSGFAAAKAKGRTFLPLHCQGAESQYQHGHGHHPSPPRFSLIPQCTFVGSAPWGCWFILDALVIDPIRENLVPHLSPLGWEHIKLTSDYVWSLSSQVAQAHLRSTSYS